MGGRGSKVPEAAKPMSSVLSRNMGTGEDKAIWKPQRKECRLWMGAGVGFGMLGTRTGVSCPVKNQKQRDLSGSCDCGQQVPGGSGSEGGL